jgi:transcriptional regulator with XRE-family HTH domain
MSTAPSGHIGARIRYWRRRRGGITQAALAGLAGVSQSFISQVESGRKSVERRATLVDLANALQVSVADLLGEPGDPTNPARAGAAAAVPQIRVALLEIEEGERRRPRRGPDEMGAAIRSMAEKRGSSDEPPRVRWRLPTLRR